MLKDGNDFLFIVSLSDLIAWPAIVGEQHQATDRQTHTRVRYGI